MWQHLFQANNLLLWGMSSIVNHNVHRADFLFKTLPKFPVGLVPDKYPNRIALVHFTGRLNIDPNNPTIRPKVISPHL
jgi:hypothetical protein